VAPPGNQAETAKTNLNPHQWKAPAYSTELALTHAVKAKPRLIRVHQSSSVVCFWEFRAEANPCYFRLSGVHFHSLALKKAGRSPLFYFERV
jgi:hypothetical protein